MSAKKIIKGSAPILEARRILQGSKAFIILADDGHDRERVFSMGYTNEQVRRILAKVLIGLTLRKTEDVPKGKLTQLPDPPEQPFEVGVKKVWAEPPPPPAFATTDSEATASGT